MEPPSKDITRTPKLYLAVNGDNCAGNFTKFFISGVVKVGFTNGSTKSYEVRLLQFAMKKYLPPQTETMSANSNPVKVTRRFSKYKI